MGDTFSKTERSEIMRKVKAHGNKSTELRLIALFQKNGITGWRRNYPVKGHPDFVFPKKKVAVFVHMMEHPQYPQIVRAGRVCAENMESDYAAPGRRERELLNRHNRKMTFLKREWQQRQNGNFVLKFKGEYLTIMPSRIY